ncbi:MAG: methyltransferase domain-containing protein [Nanoarchaeota archaeon]
MNLSRAASILARYDIKKPLERYRDVYRAIERLGDSLSEEEHLVLFDALWFMKHRDNSFALPESLKLKLIKHRKIFSPLSEILEIHAPHLITLIIELCDLSESEQAALWQAFHIISPESCSREATTIEKNLKLDNFIMKKSSSYGKIKVLDIGCGRGWTIIGLVDKYLEKIVGFGVDFNIDPSTFRHPGVKLTQVNLANGLPFLEGSFDLAYSYQVFRYFTKKEGIVSLLKDILRVLRKEGVFVFEDDKKSLDWYKSEIFPQISSQCELSDHPMTLIKK